MTEPQHEYMDTGALTEDAVPESDVAQPPVEAPGSPSSEVVNNASPEESVGSTGPDANLPHGAKLTDGKETIAGSPPGDPTLPQ